MEDIIIIFILQWHVQYFLRARKNKEYKSKIVSSKTWKCISLIIVIIITSFYGLKIYKSATNYGGKLAWVIKRLQSERDIKFEKNNIYKYGVKGIFEDISKRYELPKKLYISDDLSVKFKKDGTITYFETFIYGKDKDGKEVNCLILYLKQLSIFL